MCGGYYSNWMMEWGGWWLWDLLWLFVLLAVVYLVIRIASRPRNPVLLGAHCPSCDSPIEAAFLRCPECGHQLKHNCPECGKIVKTRWDVCPYCETNLETHALV